MALVGLLKFVQRTSSANACRFYCSMSNKRGIVLGVHTGKDQDKYELTSFAKRYDESIGGKLSESLKM
ncbi:unnamed protein product [Hermetia illucens]|uniref:Uncharacterized protein n=1 Tax=Hermetia illucens TaxID=343691 RepID=A0A7R8UY99_HERIL|nr:unnamed protein product [Hermetia illucens]